MTFQIPPEIEQLLRQARKLLPEPPPLEDQAIAQIHKRILDWERVVNNLRVKREREAQKSFHR